MKLSRSGSNIVADRVDMNLWEYTYLIVKHEEGNEWVPFFSLNASEPLGLIHTQTYQISRCEGKELTEGLEVFLSRIDDLLPTHEDLRTAYQEVCSSYRTQQDFRTKLLGFLPLVSGAGIFFLLNDTLTNPAKQGLSVKYLLPIGLVGAAVTVGLYCYEVRSMGLADGLEEAGKIIEERLHIQGQFTKQSPPLWGIFNDATAANLIFPAVWAGWLILALVFVSPPAAFIVAGISFILGLSFLFFWGWLPNTWKTVKKKWNERKAASSTA